MDGIVASCTSPATQAAWLRYVDLQIPCLQGV